MSKYICGNCDHIDVCYVPRSVGCVEQCEHFKGRPSGEQTNEEWFCGLSTKGKAEFLVKIELSAMPPVKRGAIDMEKFIEEVVEWLKQPHTNE